MFGANYDMPLSYFPERRKFLTLTSAVLSGIPFLTMIYGITKGKYRYIVENIKLSFKELPEAFEGYRIVQISDIHAGSFDNKAQVERGIRMVNELNPDLILFTGDLINSHKDEIQPYIDSFKQLKARDGIFAVLGNHDYYGLYSIDNEGDKKKYWNEFLDVFKDLGFTLLNNSSVILSKGNDKINLLGVENWGAGQWFPKKGDLDKCFEGLDDRFTILMSHDPTHWDEKILPFKKHVHLTLSGHTHGFQFGVNFPGFKWSPAQYRYPRWIGLYMENEQVLYVNRGFGFLAFPGRIGIWPEITLFELSKTV